MTGIRERPEKAGSDATAGSSQTTNIPSRSGLASRYGPTALPAFAGTSNFSCVSVMSGRSCRIHLPNAISRCAVAKKSTLYTVADAYQFAAEWCGNSPEQKAAIRACKAALTGDVDPETARGVFVAFARKKEILMEDGIEHAPSRKRSAHHV